MGKPAECVLIVLLSKEGNEVSFKFVPGPRVFSAQPDFYLDTELELVEACRLIWTEHGFLPLASLK